MEKTAVTLGKYQLRRGTEEEGTQVNAMNTEQLRMQIPDLCC